jgi:hypothetical protein
VQIALQGVAINPGKTMLEASKAADSAAKMEMIVLTYNKLTIEKRAVIPMKVFP